jgi:hypothetical protein
MVSDPGMLLVWAETAVMPNDKTIAAMQGKVFIRGDDGFEVPCAQIWITPLSVNPNILGDLEI